MSDKGYKGGEVNTAIAQAYAGSFVDTLGRRGDVMEKTAKEIHGSDICACGDYRSQHENGVGKCGFCFGLSGGYNGCDRFRFACISKDRTHWEQYHGQSAAVPNDLKPWLQETAHTLDLYLHGYFPHDVARVLLEKIRENWPEMLTEVPEPERGTESDGPCADCGYPCEVWFAPNDTWNSVIAVSRLLCVRCFIRRAEEKGIKPTAWMLQPEPAPSPLPVREQLSAGNHYLAGFEDARNKAMQIVNEHDGFLSRIEAMQPDLKPAIAGEKEE